MSRREASVELEQTLLVVARGKGILRVEPHTCSTTLQSYEVVVVSAIPVQSLRTEELT